MKWLFVLFVAIAVPAWADEAQLVMPQLTKPATEAAEGDALHEKYEAAWTRYEKTIGEVRDKVNAALDAQFEKAADAGNLDLADMWDKKKKLFLDTSAVAWPSDAGTKVQWRKTYPTTDFPNDFTDVIAGAGAGFEKAVATLKEDYESLVKDYTKERNLAQAKALREELAALARKPAAAEERPKMVEKKPEREQDAKPPAKETGLQIALRPGLVLQGKATGFDGVPVLVIDTKSAGIVTATLTWLKKEGNHVVPLRGTATSEAFTAATSDNKIRVSGVMQDGPGTKILRMDYVGPVLRTEIVFPLK